MSLSPEYSFVLEDEEGIWGYALGTVHIKPFIKKCKMCWIPNMQEKYTKPNCEEQLSEAQASDSRRAQCRWPVTYIVGLCGFC